MAKAFYPENNAPKAIPTQYKNYLMRSRLEARWASFFDHLGVRWQYETERYKAGEKTYLPDFYLPDQNTYVEIKPLKGERGTPLSVYLAGKVSRNDWRHNLVPRLRGADWTDQRWLRSGHLYNGPFFKSCDHGCAHSSDAVHGAEEPYCIGSIKVGSPELIAACKCGISSSSIVFAWLDSAEAYGTFAEIGLAKGMGRQVWAAMSYELRDALDARLCTGSTHARFDRPHDLWFVMGLADKRGYFNSPSEALDAWLPKDDADLVPMGEFSRTNGTECLLLRGTPDPQHLDYEVFYWGNEGYGPFRKNNGILGLYEGRLMWISQGFGFKATKEIMRSAMLAARQARFEYGERG